MKIVIETKTFSLIIIAVLSAVTLFMAYQLYAPKITGYSQYQGYSSYEEMMQAHHGGSGDMSGSCGGVTVQSGEKSEYGITYDQTGYQQLVKYNSLSLTNDQANTIIGLNVQIPCCGFEKILASGNCGCEHHLALYGLAKFLATKGYDRNYIQTEIDKWKTIFDQSNIGGCG